MVKGVARKDAPSFETIFLMAKVSIRPLGGGPGCLMMIMVSVIASVVLTILLNVILR